jgi:predicted DNA-binding transcriptional regulator AlpA
VLTQVAAARDTWETWLMTSLWQSAFRTRSMPSSQATENSRAVVRRGEMTADRGEGLAPHFITVQEFAKLACVSRRTIKRYRLARPSGFPREFDMGRGRAPRPRFRIDDVKKLDSRALW